VQIERLGGRRRIAVLLERDHVAPRSQPHEVEPFALGRLRPKDRSLHRPLMDPLCNPVEAPGLGIQHPRRHRHRAELEAVTRHSLALLVEYPPVQLAVVQPEAPRLDQALGLKEQLLLSGLHLGREGRVVQDLLRPLLHRFVLVGARLHLPWTRRRALTLLSHHQGDAALAQSFDAKAPLLVRPAMARLVAIS
jgi:hypothetical protein